MKVLRRKEEVAGYVKVSVPTLNKFLKKYKGLTDKGMVDIRKLNRIINKECLKKYSKKGK